MDRRFRTAAFRQRILAALLALHLFAPAVLPQEKQLEVPGDATWIDTGLDVKAGDLWLFEASGELKYSDSQQPATPEGLSRGWRDLLRTYPLNSAGRGALIGRIGDNSASYPFLIGARRESRAQVAGRLFVGINNFSGAKGEGAFKLTISKMGAAASASAEFTGSVPPITEEILARIPRRVVDPDGTEGDRVNFLVLGGEDQLKKALLDMGWVVVDRTIKDTILRGALSTLSKQAYLTIPMSELRVFGRGQDYGFAHSDPIKTVAARHHFRVWKAPFAVDGWTLWVGAGTHDVGFDKDQRTGGITHKIDPDTDKEREFIGESLRNSGQVVKSDYVVPKDTITRAKTAHGQEFFSDGRILVLYMRPDESNQAPAFGDYFCSVLSQKNPDTGEWEDCGKWIEKPGKKDLALRPLPASHRVVVVPGIFSSCAADRPAFDLGRKALQETYSIQTDLINVPNDSSESNAKLIAEWLRKETALDSRPIILIGYSKGTPDIQTMLAAEPELRSRITAFISVAGASGGSPIADSLPSILDKYAQQAKFGKCEGDLSKGMKSLRQDVRKRFLSSHPHPYVKTYSLVAIVNEENASKTSLQSYRMLSAWDRQNDGQLLKLDAIVPESTYLGAARTDHLTVALPFESQGAKPAYPRAALLEAMLRFVFDDLRIKPGNTPAAKPSGWGDPK